MKVVSIQLNINQNQSKKERFTILEKRLRQIEALKEGPDLVLLPELWNVGFFDYESYAEWAEMPGGETVKFLSDWAKRLQCYFLAGSIVERADHQKIYNTSLFFGRTGELLNSYRKIHLFGFESKESEILTAGSDVAAADTEFGKIGIATCYDLRFPEQFRAMADMGVSIIAVVSAWPIQRLSHWRLFNQVRALENQSFLISCNSSGEQLGVKCAGHSMIVAPDGEILLEAGEEEQFVSCEIDIGKVREYRESFPALQDIKILNYRQF